jgi:hypothetical protein
MDQNSAKSDAWEFITQLKTSPTFIDASAVRPLDCPQPFSKGIDFLLAIARKQGYSISAQDLIDALTQVAEDVQSQESKEIIEITKGFLGFSGLKAGLSNPTEVMCQYHAPIDILANYNPKN